jgi:hypothetical protein
MIFLLRVSIPLSSGSFKKERLLPFRSDSVSGKISYVLDASLPESFDFARVLKEVKVDKILDHVSLSLRYPGIIPVAVISRYDQDRHTRTSPLYVL